MYRREKAEIILKLNMILGVIGLHGILYVETLLSKIKLTKEIFLDDIEDGIETIIPKDLS